MNLNINHPWDLEDPQKRARLMQCLVMGGFGLAPGLTSAFYSKLADKLSDDRSIFTPRSGISFASGYG